MSDCEEPCDGCPRRAEHHLCDECCHAEPDALSRENKRLRAALQAIASMSPSRGTLTSTIVIARAALQVTP